MSEFKFCCPVCGQHIAADPDAAGAQIECPTCFQRIIIPVAPKASSKYILSATQYIKPPAPPAPPPPPPARSRQALTSTLFAIVFVLSLVLVGVYAWFHLRTPAAAGGTGGSAPAVSRIDPHWQPNLEHTLIPTEPVRGVVRDRPFQSNRAVVQSGSLALRQGTSDSPDLVINVYLPAEEPAQLQERSFLFATNDSGSVPRVALRWMEGDLRVAQMFTNGYALRLEFGKLDSNRIPGKIYLCTPDASRSWVAGQFEAEVRKGAWPR
ncbi:MAG: hypothetical protein U1F98_07895 [Verrucomicrobiota bacterium]